MKRLAATVVLAMGAVLLSPVPAVAAPPGIVFVEPNVTAAFGGDWLLEIAVTSGGAPVGPSAGTVDVTVAGVAGIFASVPLQSDGHAYVTQPIDQPLLPAGTHQVTALFTPTGGSGLSSATSAPATLTITPLAVTVDVSAGADPAVGSAPVISSTLSGDYVSAMGTLPAGIWSFDVTAAGSSTALFSTRRVQDPFATEPLTVEVPGSLRASTDYRVEWRFEPAAELAGGLELTTEGTTTFRTPDATILTTLAAPISWPLWAWITFAVVLLALVATAVVLLVRWMKRRPRMPRQERTTGGDDESELATDDEIRALLTGPSD
jgi:hypothetical protein